MQILTDNPNTEFQLSAFAEQFGCAKSSISEDIRTVKGAMDGAGLGYVVTIPGAKGGVKYVPYISDKKTLELMEELRQLYSEPDRRLGSGFLYTSDIMFNPHTARSAALVFAKRFRDCGADMVVTVETKGMGVAMFTAELLNLPLAVIRRESKISEGSTVSINFFSGSADRLQKMSLAKRAIKPGTKAIIIDDFMRGGGSIKGMKDMLREFDSSAVAMGVVVAAKGAADRKLEGVFPLLYMSESGESVSFEVNPELLTQK